MSKLKFYNDGILITEPDIVNFEKEYKIKFPADYRQYLLSRTGSTKSAWWFDSIDDDGNTFACELEDLCSLVEVGEKWNLHIEFCQDFDEGYFPEPECFQCIGTANGGNNLFMGFEKEHYGKIYLFCYDMYPDFHLLANSFTEFIEMLKPPEDTALENQ